MSAEPVQSRVSRGRHSGLLLAKRTHASYTSSGHSFTRSSKVRRRAETSGKSAEASKEEHTAQKPSLMPGATLGRRRSRGHSKIKTIKNCSMNFELTKYPK